MRFKALTRFVLRSAARLIGGIPKFGHVSKYMLVVLRWLLCERFKLHRKSHVYNLHHNTNLVYRALSQFPNL